MIKWNGIHLSISMIILIFPPRGKIRQIVFDPFLYKAALRMKFTHRAKDIFLFGLCTFWTQFVNEYICNVLKLLINLNDTNAMQGYYAQSLKKWSNFNLRKLPFSSIWSPLVGLSRFFMKLMARLSGVLFKAQTNPKTKLMAGLGRAVVSSMAHTNKSKDTKLLRGEFMDKHINIQTIVDWFHRPHSNFVAYQQNFYGKS